MGLWVWNDYSLFSYYKFLGHFSFYIVKNNLITFLLFCEMIACVQLELHLIPDMRQYSYINEWQMSMCIK